MKPFLISEMISLLQCLKKERQTVIQITSEPCFCYLCKAGPYLGPFKIRKTNGCQKSEIWIINHTLDTFHKSTSDRTLLEIVTLSILIV